MDDIPEVEPVFYDEPLAIDEGSWPAAADGQHALVVEPDYPVATDPVADAVELETNDGIAAPDDAESPASCVVGSEERESGTETDASTHPDSVTDETVCQPNTPEAASSTSEAAPDNSSAASGATICHPDAPIPSVFSGASASASTPNDQPTLSNDLSNIPEVTPIFFDVPAYQPVSSAVSHPDTPVSHPDDPICHPERSEGSSPSSQSPPSTDASTHIPCLTTTTASSGEARIAVDDEDLARHEQNTILAQVTAGISRAAFDVILAKAGGFDALDVTDEDLAYGLVRLGITDGSTVRQAIERIKRVAGVIDAQPNYVYRVNAEETGYTVANDFYASRQWGLFSVNAHAAWDLVKTNGSVAVAVIDTGADLDHPDLAPNIVASYNSLSNANIIEDQVGHGTHVAGIISGVADNGIGVAGVSWNASLVIIKASAYNSLEFDTASIVRAYVWLESRDSSGMTVAEHYNVRVVNMSIGGVDAERSSNLPDDALNKAMLKARDEFGILTVVAAGNVLPFAAPCFAYPGDSDACISVMNLCEEYNDDGEPIGVDLDPTSNYNVEGSYFKDICAPGTYIHSTWIDGKYATDDGTSMAAPMVAGIAAMLFAANPTLTPKQVMRILEASATDLGDEGWDELYGYGEVNAAAAVRMASSARVKGFEVVGVGGTAGYVGELRYGIEANETGYTWQILPGEGYATIDNSTGVLMGLDAGDVTVVGTCVATTGAELSATKTVYIIDPEIIGDDAVTVGSESGVYSTDDDRWTWVWQVENYTGKAHIDQDAILHADEAGLVYVTATCAENTDIVIHHRVTIA